MMPTIGTERRQKFVQATVKMLVLDGSGKSAGLTALFNLDCTPLDPVDPEVHDRYTRAGGATEILETFAFGDAVIPDGAYLSVDGFDYPIRACAVWPASHQHHRFLHILIEQVRK